MSPGAIEVADAEKGEGRGDLDAGFGTPPLTGGVRGVSSAVCGRFRNWF